MTLTALCLRYEEHWAGARCRGGLILRFADLRPNHVAAIGPEVAPAAMAQALVQGEEADLLKFFVDPLAMGRGHGVRLFRWAVELGRAARAQCLMIEADPDAEAPVGRIGTRSKDGGFRPYRGRSDPRRLAIRRGARDDSRRP